MPSVPARLLAACSIAWLVLAACSAPQRGVSGGGSLIEDAAARAAAIRSGTSARRYIANTGGQGVRLRAECRDDAAAQGTLTERSEVTVDAVGSGPCAGWSRVHGGALVSWVRNEFLVETLPPEVAATTTGPGAAAAPGGGGAGAGPAAPAGVIPNATRPPSSFSFTAPAGARVMLDEIDGTATLWGGPSQLVYLGLIASTPLPDSVCNPTGRHGSTTGAESIRNTTGAYGSASAETSAYNPSAGTPPVIKHRNATVAIVTRDASVRGALDPDALLGALCR